MLKEKKNTMTKICLENCHVKMLYEKLNHHILKKDHHYKNHFLENHATAVNISYNQARLGLQVAGY